MIKNILDNLLDLRELLKGLSTEHYTKKLDLLNGSSIGQHIRHIVEFYQCLLIARHSKQVNYDARKRDWQLEADLQAAVTEIDSIMAEIKTVNNDFAISFVANFGLNETEQATQIPSSFYRELAYNLEHSIHHQALIKLAILDMQLIGLVKPNFCYAPSTIRYQQKICVQ